MMRNTMPCAAQEIARLHREEGVAYKDVAILLRCFKSRGARTHLPLQVWRGGVERASGWEGCVSLPICRPSTLESRPRPMWPPPSTSPLQASLNKLRVPFVLIRDTGLFERAEVVDTVAYLK
jgi:superfamily I DNA/RNA helicase